MYVAGCVIFLAVLWGLCHRLKRIEQRIRDLECRHETHNPEYRR
jgi:hypothetical protein